MKKKYMIYTKEEMKEFYDRCDREDIEKLIVNNQLKEDIFKIKNKKNTTYKGA